MCDGRISLERWLLFSLSLVLFGFAGRCGCRASKEETDTVGHGPPVGATQQGGIFLSFLSPIRSSVLECWLPNDFDKKAGACVWVFLGKSHTQTNCILKGLLW